MAYITLCSKVNYESGVGPNGLLISLQHVVSKILNLSLNKFFSFHQDMTEANTPSGIDGTTVWISVTKGTPSSDYSDV